MRWWLQTSRSTKCLGPRTGLAVYLEVDRLSRVVPVIRDEQECSSLPDVCSGLEGLSMVFGFCGVTTISAVDISQLACDTFDMAHGGGRLEPMMETLQRSGECMSLRHLIQQCLALVSPVNACQPFFCWGMVWVGRMLGQRFYLWPWTLLTCFRPDMCGWSAWLRCARMNSRRASRLARRRHMD